MVECLLNSGEKFLDFQANNEKSRKLETPVAIPNLSLPLAADPPPLPFEYIFSTPTEDSVPDLVGVSSTNHYETLLTVVVNISTRGGGVSGSGFFYQFQMLKLPLQPQGFIIICLLVPEETVDLSHN